MAQYDYNSYGDIASNKSSFDKFAPLKEAMDGTAESVADEKINELVNGAPEQLDTLKEIADKIESMDIPDMSNYPTNDDVNSAIEEALEPYAKTEDLPNLDDYALKSELPDVSNFITEDALEGYAKTEDLPDMSNYAEKSEIPDVSEFITEEALEPYAKSEDLPDLTDYALKSELPDVSEFITEEALEPYAKAEDLDGYAEKDSVYTKEESDEKFLTEHQSLEDYLLASDAAETYQTKAAMSAYADGAEYDSNAKKIYLKNGDTVLSEIDATEFIKDGMVDSVAISTPDSGANEGKPCLVITFNTDSGKSPIELPLSDMFNTDNYYTKDETDAALALKADKTELEPFAIKSEVSEDINAINDTLSGLATVASTGSYNDLEDKPEPVSLTGYATENYVDDKVSSLVNGAPEALDTLSEIAAKLGEEDDAVSAIVSQLAGKAESDDVYTIADADEKFVDRTAFNELNQKYTTLLNVVYSTATGDSATALNPDYVESSLSSSNTSVTVTEGKLGDVTIPEATKTYTVTAPMSDGANVDLSTPRAFNLINTSNEPVNVTINVPETTSSSAPTISLSGDFNTLTVNNGSVGAKSGADPLTVNDLVINNEQGKNANVSGVVFGDDATITSDVPNLGLSNNNTSVNNNVPDATINAENSTVTLNKGEWNELTSNVSGETLIVTQNAHINTLNIVKGNVVVNDYDVANRIGNVVNETEYTVTPNTHHATTGAELNSMLTGNPGIVVVDNDITRGRITWGILGSGNYMLDLAGNTVTISDAMFGIKTRNKVNLKIVDTVGGGKIVNDKSYCLWAGENTVITIDVPTSTEIIGMTHTLYCEGSGHPSINVAGGTFKMIVDPEATDAETYDVNGHYRFMLNHLDSTYTREGNCFNITGGKFYNFNPMESYGEPGSPVNLLGADYTVVHTVEDGVDVYEVVHI